MDAILLTSVSVIVCIATLVTSLTIILLHFKSTVLRDDVVVKMMASLCVSGLGLGFLVPAASFVMAQWDVDDPWLATFQDSSSELAGSAPSGNWHSSPSSSAASSLDHSNTSGCLRRE